MTRNRRSTRSRPTTTALPVWARWPDDRLLKLRMCDLGLRIEDSPLQDIGRSRQRWSGTGTRINPATAGH